MTGEVAETERGHAVALAAKDDPQNIRPRLDGSPDRSHLLATGPWPTLPESRRQAFERDLRALLPPDRISLQLGQRIAYSYDATSERCLPDAIAFPVTEPEVADLVALASAYGMPVVARGAASGLSGGAVPVAGGLVVSFSRMRRLLEVDAARRRAWVEPGFVNRDLSAAVSRYGLGYAPDPASHRVSTLGGNVAENSGGPHCALYGVTTQHVEDLAVVTANGEAIRLPHVRDRVEGIPDLTGLVVGSEGTLALVTGVRVRLSPLSAGHETLLGIFPDPETACAAVSAVVAQGLLPSTLELMDRATLKVVEAFSHAGYPAEAGAVVIAELDGDEEVRTDEAAQLEAVFLAAGALSVRRAATPAERDALWRGRRSAYGALARLASHIWVQDVTVPRPRLAQMLAEVRRIAIQHGLPIPTVAHAGDGNLHPNIPYHAEDAAEVARMRAADREILEVCCALGGSITGEHGIGIDKLEALALMYGETEISLMWAVKTALDPDGRLNPLKAVISPDQVRAAGLRFRAPCAASEYEKAAVSLAEAARAPGLARPVPAGGGRRLALVWDPSAVHAYPATAASAKQAIDVDADNLTAVVPASTSPAELASALKAKKLRLRTPPSGRTVGGFIARDPFRPSRATGHSARDSVLALTVVAGSPPALAHFGRATMKNVAGYDMVRLWVGSWGRFGTIVSATFRLWPDRPITTWQFEGELADVLAAADRILGAKSPSAVQKMAVWPKPGGRGLGVVQAEAPAKPQLVQQGWHLVERGESPLQQLEDELETAEIGAATGGRAIVQAWDLSARDQLAACVAAASFATGPVWTLPGTRVVAAVDGDRPSPAVREFCDSVLQAGGQVSIASATPAWRLVAPSPPTSWREWTHALDRALGSLRGDEHEGVIW